MTRIPHKHARIISNCKTCMKIQAKWYSKLKQSGFIDIEYGLENPRFIAKNVDASDPVAQQSQEYYSAVWRVFRAWARAKRSARDLRLCELYAEQIGKTGTVRGIAKVLNSEHLRPWSQMSVQETLKEIKAAIFKSSTNQPVESATYIEIKHKAA